MIPNSKPALKRERVEEILDANNVMGNVRVLMVRGYYLDSMGVRGENDRGVYDDAAFVVSPTLFASFNANTDPSRYRKGWGFGNEKGMAQLTEGVWRYRPGIHYGSSPHPAFRQDGVFVVKRDGTRGDYLDRGSNFGINNHRGGVNGTSSLGCLTIPPKQWSSYYATIKNELDRYDQFNFLICLVNEKNIRVGNLKI